MSVTRDKGQRRKFTTEEDGKIKQLVEEVGYEWEEVSRELGTRTPKQVRDRYLNYLQQGLRNDPWTPEEDAQVIRMRKKFGPKWVRMSRLMPGRSSNDIKNRWHRHLAKQVAKSMGEVPVVKPEPDPTEEMGKDIVIDKKDFEEILQFVMDPNQGEGYDG